MIKAGLFIFTKEFFRLFKESQLEKQNIYIAYFNNIINLCRIIVSGLSCTNNKFIINNESPRIQFS